VKPVETVNATIPCNQTNVQELGTDLLVTLAGHTRISPPVQFYRDLETIGQVQGFRAQQTRDGSARQPAEFAAQLVTDALENPLTTVDTDNNTSEHFFSLLHSGEEVTLEEFDAVRNKITSELTAVMGQNRLPPM